MDQCVVNYLFKILGGNLYYSGDFYYFNYYVKYGNEYWIDVVFGLYGENLCGIIDKMISVDILCMVELFNVKVVILFYYDIWLNFQVDLQEICVLWEMKKDCLKYGFKLFIWQVGGKFIWLLDKDNFEYYYLCGFDDCFIIELDLFFKFFL